MTKLVLFAPAYEGGGTTNLLVNLASHWRDGSVDISVVDFADGFTARTLSERGTIFEHREYRRGGHVEVGPDEVLLAPVLPASGIGEKIRMHADARLLLWITHSQDCFKWLPFYHPARTWSDTAKARYARLVHPAYHRRLRACWTEGVAKGGLLAMDENTAHAVVEQFGLPVEPPIVPIFTDTPRRRWAPSPSSTLRVAWLGRLCDFKTQPVITLIREVAALSVSGRPAELAIIGDGEDRSLIEAEIARNPGANARILGQMPADAVNEQLAERTDLLCAHGTSVLEGAKLGVPSVVIDPTYHEIATPEERRMSWLFTLPDADVGQLRGRTESIRGLPLAALLKDGPSLVEAGRQCYDRWRAQHSPDAAATGFSRRVRDTRWMARDLKRCGARRFGLLGTALMGARQFYTRDKY